MMDTETVDSAASAAVNPPKPGRRIRGWWVVLTILTFGAVLTGINWGYWKLHIAPFLPLQKLLAVEYPGSKPRVEGGQRKIHNETPKLLRITMMLDYDPLTDAGKIQSEQFAKTVATFVSRDWADLADYELLELHLYWPEPEQKIKSVTISFALPTLSIVP